MESDSLVPRGVVWAWIQTGLASDTAPSHRKRLASLGNIVHMCYRTEQPLPTVAKHSTEKNLHPISAGTSNISVVAYITRWR